MNLDNIKKESEMILTRLIFFKKYLFLFTRILDYKKQNV